MPLPEFSEAQLAGHLLVECLIEQGVSHAFGVPGESYLAALDGFHHHRDRIRFIVNRQEGGAGFMAEAHGKLSGRPGVCFVTRGPGATNAAIAIHLAFQDSTPLVMFVGDVPSEHRDREAFQELDFSTFFGPSTGGMAKRVERVDDPNRLPEYVARAFSTAMSGRPGPVVLVLPEDMLAQRTSARPLPRVEPARTGIAAETLESLRERLSSAQRPLVIAGGGGWTVASAQALQSFAEAWRLPVANAFRFQDCFDNHHPLYAGDLGLGASPQLAQRLRECDLVLAIGARLGEATTGGYTWINAPCPHQQLVHIHASAEELNRVYRAELAINASMDAAAPALATLRPPATLAWATWAEAANADYLDNLEPRALGGRIDMPAIIGLLQHHLPADAVLTNGAGNFAAWAHRFFRYRGLARGYKTQLAPTAGAMGYGVPAGIAASLVTGRTVVTIAGDGDFLMNGQELSSAVQYGGKSIVVLLNNGMLGTIRMHQEREFPSRVVSTALVNPDFVTLARAYGYEGVRITDTADFEAELLAALERPQGTVIELVIDPELISPRATLTEIRQASQQRLTQA